MGLIVRRPRAALRKFDSKVEYWHNAKLIVDADGAAEIITYWRNPEIAGIWELRYTVTRECLVELLKQGLIIQDGSDNLNSYKLSAKGLERLSKN